MRENDGVWEVVTMNLNKRHLDRWVASPIGPLFVALGAATTVALLIILVEGRPALEPSYPFVLTPLLVVGPLAVRPVREARQAVLRAALAGLVSAAATIAVLTLATQQLADQRWSFTGPLSMPPVPPLPRLSTLPFLGWSLHYLFVAIGLSVALHGGITFLLTHPRLDPFTALEQRLAALRASLRTKLSITFLLLAALTLMTGGLSFMALEEIHFTGHRRQFQMAWLKQLTDAEELLNQVEESLLRSDAPPAVAAKQLREVQSRLFNMSTTLRAGFVPGERGASNLAASAGLPYEAGDSGYFSYGGGDKGVAAQQVKAVPIVLRAEQRRAFVAAYVTELDTIEQRISRLASLAELPDPAAVPTRLQAVREVRLAITALRQRLEHDVAAEVDQADLSHHTILIAILALAIAATLMGLVFGRVAGAAITSPIQMIARHLIRVAQADFKQQVQIRNADELGQLASVLNWMTGSIVPSVRHERSPRRWPNGSAS